MTARAPRILAVGGGGFTVGPADAALDRLVVELTGVERPRVCLLPTASGDPLDQIRRFELTFRRFGAETSHVSLFRLGRRPLDLADHLLAQDAIYVGGGSLLNLLAIWRAHRLDAILARAWRAGIVLAGVSAGSMCWFAGGVTTSYGLPRRAGGLGFLPASNCVHYDSEAHRRPCFLAALREGTLPPGYGVDDGAGLLFEGDTLAEVVTARPGAGATHVHVVGREPVETPLPARLLEPAENAGPDDEMLAEFRALHARR